MLETKRLLMEEWQKGDEILLQKFLQDEKVMYAYEHAFSDEEVQNWLNWNLQSYQNEGIGLWKLSLKTNGETIGECGLTTQKVDGIEYLEIGYHLCYEYWHNGYAFEAASACKKYAFEILSAAEVVSIVRDMNIASMNVAIRNGMLIKKRFYKHYYGKEMAHYLFSVRNKI